MTQDAKNIQAEEQLATATQSINHSESPNESSSSAVSRPRADEEKNWKEVRQIMKEQRQRIEELESRVAPKSAPPQKEEDEFANLSEDDIVTVADMKKYAAKIAKKTAQELYEDRRRQQEIESTPSRYSDYHDVIQYVEPLVKQNPALYAAIENSPNPRETAYQMAKMYLASQKGGEVNARKIEENLSKPRVSDSIGSNTSFDAASSRRDLNLSDRAKIWEQAQKYASMR